MATGIVVVAAVAVGGLALGRGAGGGGTHVTGKVDLDNLLASGPANLDCSRVKMRVEIADGSGKVLRIASGDTHVVSETGKSGHVFGYCEGTYDVSVPPSDVYRITSDNYPDQVSGKLVSEDVNASDLKSGEAPRLLLLFDPSP